MSNDEEEYHSTILCDGLYRMYLQKTGVVSIFIGTVMNCISHRSPMLSDVSGNGLYIRVGSRVYDGKGLLLGPRSPFRNIPILKWIV